MPDDRILLISPVFNEGAHIEAVIEAVAAQELPPARWIVIDDASTDGTLEILRRWEAKLPFLTVVDTPWPKGSGRDADGLAQAREAIRFNQALALENLAEYDFVGKLDGDIALAPEHFRTLIERFAVEPTLGIAGCMLIEPTPDGGWRELQIPDYHVHGAVKLYRTRCFADIGGMPGVLGWDVVDETYARMRGYVTRTFRDLTARHLRPEGSAAGQIRGRARAGEVAYIVRYEPWWVVPRSLKVACTPPYGIAGAAFLYGYVRAWARRRERLGDAEYQRFVRGELRARITRRLRPARA